VDLSELMACVVKQIPGVVDTGQRLAARTREGHICHLSQWAEVSLARFAA
jgi:hypothetical protein